MNEKEKNASIEYILSQGLGKQPTVKERMEEMLKTMGFRFIFWDKAYSLIFAAVTIVVAFALFMLVPRDYRYSAAIAFAPLLFLLVTLFAETSERACGLYELKQTCHYTIGQIIALRVISYSVVGALFTAVIAAFSVDSTYEFLSLLPLCLSALFICGVLALSAMRFLQGKWGNATFSAVWVFVNLALPFSFGEKWEKIMREMPILISVAIAILGAAALAYQLSKMLSEEKKYALA
ncbi:hypothetical protein PA598K_04092 [Paenibacillus sp. 598K]|uniref:hypothetical protein n=1 Tax=Paenibacillus sp. 598K TaxID=1117987 RepID=UPI000FFAD9E4|nr:hypothetical protein [Paenibacillus sp. 598K]GBF75671.1 hypothetical protein PA598K_04092 [Paenibacillus sp. 598K]